MAEKKKILVISDGDLKETLAKALAESAEFYDVIYVTRRSQTKNLGAAIARENPDLIIMEIMPDIRVGLMTCLKLRSFYPSLPFLLLAAAGDMFLEMDTTYESFLSDPITSKDLGLQIAQIFLRQDI
jgi:CheY-like chemotaxis protein